MKATIARNLLETKSLQVLRLSVNSTLAICAVMQTYKGCVQGESILSLSVLIYSGTLPSGIPNMVHLYPLKVLLPSHLWSVTLIGIFFSLVQVHCWFQNSFRCHLQGPLLLHT